MKPNYILFAQGVACTPTRAADCVCFPELLPWPLHVLQGLVHGHKASVSSFSCCSFGVSIWHATHVLDMLLQGQNDTGSPWPHYFHLGLVNLLGQLIQDPVTPNSEEHRHIALLSQVVDDGGRGDHIPVVSDVVFTVQTREWLRSGSPCAVKCLGCWHFMITPSCSQAVGSRVLPPPLPHAFQISFTANVFNARCILLK